MHAPNIESQCMRQKQIAIKQEVNSNTIVVALLSLTSHFHHGRSVTQKINKKTQALNNILDQMYLIDTYRILHLKAEGYTFFSIVHRTFSWIDHILGPKSSIGKFKKVEII